MDCCRSEKSLTYAQSEVKSYSFTTTCSQNFLLVSFSSQILPAQWQRLYLVIALKLDFQISSSYRLRIFKPVKVNFSCISSCLWSWKLGEEKVAVITKQMHLMRSPLASQLRVKLCTGTTWEQLLWSSPSLLSQQLQSAPWTFPSGRLRASSFSIKWQHVVLSLLLLLHDAASFLLM